MSNKRSVHVRWLGDYRTDINIRGVHRIRGDETPRYGGDDTGPMPTELLLASVASCMCLAVYHLAKKRRITLRSLEIGASAEKDMTAFRFQEIQLVVQADLPADLLAPLVEKARAYCFVSNTVIAGCPIHITTESTEAAA